MEKFTQGPWMVNKSIPPYIYNNEHGSICRIHFINSRELNSLEESSANAALISAAPEMYEALSDICKVFKKDGRFPKTWREIEKLLRKARGER